MTPGHAGNHASRPRGKVAVRMIWSDLLFIHWPVPAASVRPLIPAALDLDLYDGMAWVGLVPFTMPLVRPWWLPRFAHPPFSAFHECNVRTYVKVGKDHGVWFFSLDAASRLAVWGARAAWHLPYYHARIGLERDGAEIDYTLDRTESAESNGPSLRCRWRVGPPLPETRSGDLAHFLTERYLMYSTKRDLLYAGPIWHDRWPLHEATLLSLEETMTKAAGITVPESKPLIHAAPRLEVDAWALRRV